MKKLNLSEKQTKILGIAIFVLVALFMLLMCYFIGAPLVKFVGEPNKFREWVDSYGVLSYLAFIGMVILQVIFAFIPGEPFEIVAGYAFGAIPGMLISILASTIGSMLVFFLVKKFGIKLVEIFFSTEKLNNLRFLKDSQKRDLLFLIIFMIPGTPKDLLSYFAGLTNMSYLSWLIICSVGRIPSVISSTVGGDLLQGENYILAIVVFAATLIISTIGIYIYNLICNKHNKNKSEEEGRED